MRVWGKVGGFHPGRYIRRWVWNLLVSLDQLGNTILGGDPDETISSRLARARERGSRIGSVGCRILDVIDPAHCDDSKGV